MKPHPLAEEYPSAAPDKLAEIAENMREHGFDRRFPVVIYEKRILDGRTRWSAASIAGVKPKTISFKGTEEQARAFAETANLHRRHLTPEQEQERRQARIGRVAELRHAGKSNRAIADEVDVSETQVRRDLEAATCAGGAHVSPPDGKVTDSIGRQQPSTKPVVRCGKCQRSYRDSNQSVKGCEACARLKSEAKAQKSGHTEPSTHEPRRRAGTAKGGKPSFDWRPFRDAVAQLKRQVDTFGNLYGVKDADEAQRLIDQITEYQKAFTAWAEKISKLPAPTY